MNSLNRLSSCTDVSCDFPFDTKTVEVSETIQTPPTITAEAENQVSGACVGSLVFSRVANGSQVQEEEEEEEEEFHSLPDQDVLEVNTVVQNEVEDRAHLSFDGSSSPMSDFTQIGNALCEVLNKVSVVLESCHRDPKPVKIELCSRRLAETMNLRALFPAVFHFTARNVSLSHDGFVCRLEEETVKEFLADRLSYLEALREVVFELGDSGCDLNYLARVTEEQLTTLCKQAALPRENCLQKPRKSDLIAIVTPFRVENNEDLSNFSPRSETVNSAFQVPVPSSVEFGF